MMTPSGHIPHAAVDDHLTHDETYRADLARRLREKNERPTTPPDRTPTS